MCEKDEKKDEKKGEKRKRPTKPGAAAGTKPIDATTESCPRFLREKRQKQQPPLITPERVKALVKETLDSIPNISLSYSASWESSEDFPVQGFNPEGAKSTLTLDGKSWTATTTSESVHAELEVLRKAATAAPEPKLEPMEIEAAAAPAAAKMGSIWIDESGHIVYQGGAIPEYYISPKTKLERTLKTRPNVNPAQWKAFRKSQSKEEQRKLPEELPDEPMDHCGYCTFFLTFLGVPTEKPTSKPSVMRGSASGAQSALRYGIPDFIRTDPNVIRRLLNKDENAVAETFLEAFASSLVEKQKYAAQEKLNQWRKEKHSLADVIAYIEKNDSTFLDKKLWIHFENFLTEALRAYKPPKQPKPPDSGAPAASSSSSTAPAPPSKK